MHPTVCVRLCAFVCMCVGVWAVRGGGTGLRLFLLTKKLKKKSKINNSYKVINLRSSYYKHKFHRSFATVMLIISVIFLLKLCNLCYSVVYNENTIKCSTVQPTEVSITEFCHYWSGHIRDLIMFISNQPV